MKLNALFEAYTIPYDFTKKKNASSNITFIKENGIAEKDVFAAIDVVKKSKEFKKIESMEFEYRSSALQEKRGTLYFESLDGNTQLTFYITGQMRIARRGGYDNDQFMGQPIKTLPPTQIGDKPTVEEVLIENLVKSMTSYLDQLDRKGAKADDAMAMVDERMKKFGFPEGFRLYIESAPKQAGYLENDEGLVYMNAKAGGTLGNVMIDYGDNPDPGKNVEIHGVEGVWRVTLRGKHIKSFKGIEKIFTSGMLVLMIDCDEIDLKELARIAPEKAKHLMFLRNPLNYPLITALKLFNTSSEISKSADKRLFTDEIKKVMIDLNAVKKGTLDIIDFQDSLIDAGHDIAAR